MTKYDIVQRIAKETGLVAAEARQVVQLLLDGMIEALARGVVCQNSAVHHAAPR